MRVHIRHGRALVRLAIGVVILLGLRQGCLWYTGDPDGVLDAFIDDLRDGRVDRACMRVRGDYMDPGRVKTLVARNPHVFASDDWSVTAVTWSYGGDDASGSARASVVGLDGRPYSIDFRLAAPCSDMGPYPVGAWRVTDMSSPDLSLEPPPLHQEGLRIEKGITSDGTPCVRVSSDVFCLDAKWTGRGWTRKFKVSQFKVTASIEEDDPLCPAVRVVRPAVMEETAERFVAIPTEIEVVLPSGHSGSRIRLELTDLVSDRSILWVVVIPP